MMAIGHQAFRPHVERVRSWDQQAEVEGFNRHFVPDQISIIQISGRDTGYFKVEQHDDHWWLDGIYLANDYQCRGIGTAVISTLCRAAVAKDIPLRLRVFRSNPAYGLYQRLGFVEISGDDDAVTMEYRAT